MNQDLLKRLALLKANPSLTNSIPQSEVLDLLLKVIAAFNELKTAVSDGRLKGADGVTPVAGKDYLTSAQIRATIANSLTEELVSLNTKAEKLEAELRTKLQSLKNGNDGKDAVVTLEHIKEAAELAASLVVLPDFRALITQENAAIRDGLELLQGDDRLDYTAIRGIDAYLDARVEELSERISSRAVSQGGTNRHLVKQMIDDALAGFSGGSDSNYVQPFTGQSTIVVTHNLNKYPSPIIFDSSGDEIEGDIKHNSLNQLTVTFNASNTGTVVCN